MMQCENVWKRAGLLLLLSSVGISAVSGSQASLPTKKTIGVSIGAIKNHTDDKSFIRLPGGKSVDDVLQENQDVLRGGAAAAALKKPQPQPLHDPILRADYIADTKLPTDMGNFRMRAYRVRGEDANANANINDGFYSNTNAMEPIIIYAADKPPFGDDNKLLENVPIRIHDQCLTSEVFRSRRCDCKEQLNLSMQYVQQHGGAVIYLQQEGRGIGLANKVAAYELQDHGLDTVDANLQLGFPDDARQYGVLPSILRHMRISSIQLMTNNPRKVLRLSELGIVIVNTIPILAVANVHNRRYLETKQDRMDHTNFGHILSNDELPSHGITNNNNHPQQRHHHPARNGMTPRRSTVKKSSSFPYRN